MTKMKILVLSAVIILGGLVAVPSAFALDGEDSGDKNKIINARDDIAAKRAAEVEAHKKAVEARKQELVKKVETTRAETKEKLTQKRLEICEKRKANINKIATKSNEQGQKHLDTFQRIQTRVMQFATDKDLKVANYDELVATADAKKAAVEAALAVAGQTTFDCNNTDASQPGKVVSDLMRTKNDALKEYRSAVKNLIAAVKQSLANTKTTQENQQ